MTGSEASYPGGLWARGWMVWGRTRQATNVEIGIEMWQWCQPQAANPYKTMFLRGPASFRNNLQEGGETLTTHSNGEHGAAG